MVNIFGTTELEIIDDFKSDIGYIIDTQLRDERCQNCQKFQGITFFQQILKLFFSRFVRYSSLPQLGNCTAYAMNVNGSDDFPGSDTWIHGGIISMRDPEWFWHIPHPEKKFQNLI